MDTKWRSNKRFFSASSVTTAYAAGAAVVGMVAALIFMSLFPFFRERAQAAYSDPLISRSFVDDLFSLNYVQYKYLREQADQTQYTYSELYLEQTLESDEADASLTGGSSEAMEMQIGDTTYGRRRRGSSLISRKIWNPFFLNMSRCWHLTAA